MINRIAFFNRLKTYNLYSKLNDGHVQGFNAILDAWEANPLLIDQRWLAYMLATAYHETAKTMQPIAEYGKGKGRKYGSKIKMSGKPYLQPDKIFYGRGFVQLTWYENYLKFGQLLGIDLLNDPDKAMEIKTATKILFTGMTQGLFTGVNLARYFNDQREDWQSARKIINGIDCAEKIAGYGKNFLECLK